MGNKCLLHVSLFCIFVNSFEPFVVVSSLTTCRLRRRAYLNRIDRPQRSFITPGPAGKTEGEARFEGFEFFQQMSPSAKRKASQKDDR